MFTQANANARLRITLKRPTNIKTLIFVKKLSLLNFTFVDAFISYKLCWNLIQKWYLKNITPLSSFYQSIYLMQSENDIFSNSIHRNKLLPLLAMAVVSVVTFYSDYPSLNLAEVCNRDWHIKTFSSNHIKAIC